MLAVAEPRVMHCCSRDEGRWLVDQHGNEVHAYALHQRFVHRVYAVVARDERAGVWVVRDRETDRLKHYVEIPPPDAETPVKQAYWALWDLLGRPPNPSEYP